MLVLDVEQDPDVVLVVRDAVAIHERRPHLADVRVLAPEGHVEETVVIADARDGLHGRSDVVAGRDLVERVDDRRLFPARVRELAVHADRRRDPWELHPEVARFLGREAARAQGDPGDEKSELHVRSYEDRSDKIAKSLAKSVQRKSWLGTASSSSSVQNLSALTESVPSCFCSRPSTMSDPEPTMTARCSPEEVRTHDRLAEAASRPRASGRRIPSPCPAAAAR